MRKPLLVTIILFSFIFSNAQIQKGSFYPGLMLGKHLNMYNSHNVHPSFSFGLSRHSSIGVFGDFNYFHEMTTPYFQGHTETWGAGIQYEYMRFFGKSTKWGWYLNATAGIYRNKFYDKLNSPPANQSYTQGVFSLTPGIFFKPSKRVLLFANFNGFSISSDQYDHFRTSFDMFMQFNVGVRVALGKQ